MNATAAGRWHRARLAGLEPVFAHDGQVEFQEIDAAGIAFFATIQTWFHECMVRYLQAAGSSLPDLLRAGTGMAPLVHAEADYLAPLRFGDRYTAALVDSDVLEARFTLGYQLRGPAGVAATGSTVHVWVDPVAFRPAPLPDDVRRVFSALSRP